MTDFLTGPGPVHANTTLGTRCTCPIRHDHTQEYLVEYKRRDFRAWFGPIWVYWVGGIICLGVVVNIILTVVSR